jgi:hypothetical protein
VEVDAETQLITRLPAESALDSANVGARARAIGLIGPLTVLAGIVWAILQPYRITLLHPREHSFWFLFVQAPLWLIAAGVIFGVFVARPLVADLEAADEDTP